MSQPTQLRGIPRRRHGFLLVGLIALVLLAIGVIVGLLYFGRVSSSPKVSKRPETGLPLGDTTFVGTRNGNRVPSTPIDKEAKEERERILKLLKDQEALNKRMLEELEAMKKRKAAGETTKAEKPPGVKRPPLGFISHERKDQDSYADASGLTPGTWIPCTLETNLNSEIDGFFTVKTRRPVMDSATGQRELIPAGQSIVAKDETAQLLFGNERIPTFALTLTLPAGITVDLGRAPITDATGTNGLTGIVDNKVWRLVWTSVFIGGLRGGQQVLQQGITADGAGPIAAGIAREGSSVTQQRLGRAQDTRPVIRVASGEVCNVLITERLSIPTSYVKR